VTPTTRLREALEATREEALALDRDALVMINVEIPQATITVRGCLEALQRLRPEVAGAFNTLDLAQYDKIERYTLALMQAHSEYLATARPAAPAPLLTQQLKVLRLVLLSDLGAVVQRKLIDGSHLDGLRGSNGSKNTATDVLTMCALVRDKWSVLEGRTAITMRDVEHAEVLADELHAALARIAQADGAVAAAAELRLRVYTLFFNAYGQARRAIAFLRWSEGDADELAPSLLAGRQKRKAKPKPEVSDPAPAALPPDPEFGLLGP
jgi:hypothetical protein